MAIGKLIARETQLDPEDLVAERREGSIPSAST